MSINFMFAHLFAMTKDALEYYLNYISFCRARGDHKLYTFVNHMQSDLN